MSGQHVLCLSGGKDSAAALVVAIENKMRLDRVIFADMQDAEFEEMYAYLDKIERTLNVKIERVKSKKWDWDSFFYSKNTKGKHRGEVRGFPPVASKGCGYKRELKMKPLLAAQGTGNVIYLGIAADEAHRANAKQYKDGKNEYRFPLIEQDITEAKAKEICESHDLINPLSKKFARLGCWCCPKQSLRSLRTLYHDYPAKWELLEKYQEACAWPFRPDGKVQDLTRRFELEDAFKLQNKSVTNKALFETLRETVPAYRELYEKQKQVARMEGQV